MLFNDFHSYCNSLSHTEETFPFDQKTLVFKCYGKMFALCDIETFESINLKCNPEYAIELREKYPSIIPGYHMNKKHWNTIILDGTVPDKLIFELIRHSYTLIISSLPKKIQSNFFDHVEN